MTMSRTSAIPNQLVILSALAVPGGTIAAVLCANWSVRTGTEVHRMLMDDGVLASGNIPLFSVLAAAAGMATIAAAVALVLCSIRRTDLSVHDVDVKSISAFFDSVRVLTLLALIVVAVVGVAGLGGLITSYSFKAWHVVAMAASVVGGGALFFASSAAVDGRREVELAVELLAIKALPAMSAGVGRQTMATASEIARKREYVAALGASGAAAAVIAKAAADVQAAEDSGADPVAGVAVIQAALSAVQEVQHQRAILINNAAPPEAVVGVTAKIDEALAHLAIALRAQGVDADVRWTEGLNLPFVFRSARAPLVQQRAGDGGSLVGARAPRAP